MKHSTFIWTLSHSKEKHGAPLQPVPATVPGAVQLDYAAALDYAPYYYGLNFRQFDWMEDEYFFYDTTLDFAVSENKAALLCFDSIDYKYEITVDGELLAAGEGIFTPVTLDVTKYASAPHALRVTIFPIPKRTPTPQNRSQASACCKPPSSYGWDWHPRLVPSGICGDTYLDILSPGTPRDLEASYRLSNDLSAVTVDATVICYGDATLRAELIAPDGSTVASQSKVAKDGQRASFRLSLDAPLLWYPRGYGEQPIYTLRVSGADTAERKLGFRRSKLILNEGANIFEQNFPKGPRCAPMQLEINGVKVFAKGSNWVNTEIFPSLATEQRYDELIQLACEANMNIFRMWGGQYINHEHFYDKCDEVGMLVWQEFMLSCNRYPDDDAYLNILEQEAVSIIRRLRTHPCLAFWCGGNELFNSWSDMTSQSHALRLLDALCYEHDRFTPYNMTSPLHGVCHGSYVKVVYSAEDRRAGDYSRGYEFIRDLKTCKSTGYTEFGCNGASPREYILKYIMDEDTYYNDCNEKNDIWREHHAFRAWQEACHLGVPEVDFFFGSHKDTDDLVEKSIYLQDMCYKAMFEEMRRQAPLCAMAINWDFNEPWPCAAGNSLVNWPAEPKSALYAVGQALRPTLLSLELPHNRYLNGEVLTGRLWVLNDSPDVAPATRVSVYLLDGNTKTLLTTLDTQDVDARKNGKFGVFSLDITEDLSERFSISLECDDHKDWNSIYSLVHNRAQGACRSDVSITTPTDDFSDFLK